MNRIVKQITALALMLALAGAGWPLAAQRADRIGEQEREQLLRQIESRASTFRRNLDAALEQSRLNGTGRAEEIKGFVRDFENATDRLQERFNDRREGTAEVEGVLRRADAIGNFVRGNLRNTQAERNWLELRDDLNTLARSYQVRWDGRNKGSASRNNGFITANEACLTGTYRLNTARSDNAESTVDRATRQMDAANRDRIRSNLSRRLEAPETLALERRGRTVTVASTRAPQVSFEADGQTRQEQTREGRNINVTANLNRNQLTVTTQGDRGNDYTVSFEPLDNCRSLRVTRRIWNERLAQPVALQSIYDRTFEQAQLNLFDEQRGFPSDNAGAQSSFAVPDGTQLIAVLDRDLNTKEARAGDRFTLTVREPSTYEGAVIEGDVGEIERSGRISGRAGLQFNFERIRLRNGRNYDFAGFIENVRTTNGDNIRVDNEGSVQREDSQTRRTATRSGIGAAVGAIIGAIAGGGKGAAIGAVVGAGTGAGSVIVQGREDLELRRGAEFTIQASAPQAAAR